MTGIRPNGRNGSGSRLASNSLQIAAWTLVSRVTGLGKIVAISSVLGPTYLGNTFLALNLVPNLVYEFLTGTLIASLLVPALVGALESGGDRRRAERLASGFLGAVTVFFSLVAGVVVALGPWILELLTIGVDDAGVAANQERVGLLLLVLFMPQVIFYGIAGVGAAAMNATGRFALAAGAPLVENLGIMATLGTYAALYGTREDLATIPVSHLVLLGGGTTFSVAAHAAVQWWGARRAGIRLTVRPWWGQPEVRDVLRRAVPSCVYAGLNAARTFAALVVANRIAGGVVAFQLAMNFFHLPVALGAKPVTVAALPVLSRLALQQSLLPFRRELRQAFVLILLLTVPAAVGYAVLARQVAEVVALGEMATSPAVTLVAAALAALAFGVVGEGAFLLATEAAYARHQVGAALASMALRAALSLALMVGAFFLSPGRYVLAALGGAITVGNLAGAWHLGRRVRRELPAGPFPWVRDAATFLLASLAMVGPAYVVSLLLGGVVPGRAGGVAAITAAAIVGIVLYVGALRVVGATELRRLSVALRREPG